MITIKLKNTYQAPSRWDDFTPEHATIFTALCCALDDYERGVFTFDQLQVAIVLALIGINEQKKGKPTEEFFENIFRFSELLTFPYRLTDNEDGSKTASITVSLFRNILPELGPEKHQGYRLDVSTAGVTDCNLTAEQYVDAVALADLYTKTRKVSALEQLTTVLYGSAKGVSPLEMTAVYYNFRGFLTWLKTLPQYDLIFQSAGKQSAPTPLGLASSIFTLSKSGYGTLKEIKGLDVFTYLGVLVQMSIDSIHQLASAGMKPGEIAEKLHLPLELVLQHTTETDPS